MPVLAGSVLVFQVAKAYVLGVRVVWNSLSEALGCGRASCDEGAVFQG